MKTFYVILSCLIVHFINAALDEDKFLPCGAEQGDKVLIDLHSGINADQADDGLFPVYLYHKIPFEHVPNLDVIKISADGYVTLGHDKFLYKKLQKFPRENYDYYTGYYNGKYIPQIAIFHTDLLAKTLTYGIHDGHYIGKKEALDKATEYVQNGTPNKHFKGEFLIVVTWKCALNFDDLSRLKFQLAIVTDFKKTYIILHYGSLDLTSSSEGVVIGWQGDEAENYYNHPYSDTHFFDPKYDHKANQLEFNSNVNCTGQYIYRVHKPYVVPDSTAVPSVTGTAPTCSVPEDYCYAREEKYYYYHNHYYVSCKKVNNQMKASCMMCPGTNLYYSEFCDECLYKHQANTDCSPKQTTVPPPVETPPQSCNDVDADDYCSHVPEQYKYGFFPLRDDNQDRHYFRCTGSYTGVCLSCAPGTVFCPTGTGSGLCGFGH